jgi:hypothetical protein
VGRGYFKTENWNEGVQKINTVGLQEYPSALKLTSVTFLDMPVHPGMWAFPGGMTCSQIHHILINISGKV